MTTYLEIINAYKRLPSEDRKNLLTELYRETEDYQLNGQHVKKCPHCDNHTFTKHGSHNNEQRYKCSQCKRTFKETTGTVIGKIRNKTLFLKYQDAMMNEAYAPISQMAKRFDISIPTAFSWRHKILLSLPEINCKFEGETEIDDLWIRYSQKGRRGLKYPKQRGGTKKRGDSDHQVKILTTVNKTQTEMKVTNIGRLSKSDIQRTMGDKITKRTVLISDKHNSISAYAKDNKIEHHSFKASDHTTSEGKGVQLLNNIAVRVGTLLNRTLCGVSTKYLQMYVNWFKFKENKKTEEQDIDLQNHILSQKYSWDLYSNIEKVYKNFIQNHSHRTYRCPQEDKFKSQGWNQHVATDYSFL